MPNPKKPTKLKILQGTFRKDRAPKNEAAPAESKKTRPPYWMTGRVRRRAWRELSGCLKELGVFTELDEIALQLLVSAYARWREASEKAELGVLRSESAQVQVNPVIKVAAAYAKEVRALLAEFGMTPSSRSRIEVTAPGGEKEDLIERMWRNEGKDPPKNS